MHHRAISRTTADRHGRRVIASAHACPALLLALLLLATIGVLPIHAQRVVFTPPQQQPPERYEASWKKNPFTLKTAPVVVEMQSFARDLAIASMYQVGDEVTVVVANTKTRERTILRGNKPSSTGMRVKLATIKDTRKESTAVVEQGGKEATLRYDTSYLKQVASSGTAAKTQGTPSGEMPAPLPKGYISSNLDVEPGDPTAVVESVHGVGRGMTFAPAGSPNGNATTNTLTNMASPLPEGYVSSNLDVEPGDPTAVVESVHGVGRGMSFDPAPPTATPIPAVSTNLDAEPGTAPPSPGESSMPTPQPPNPAPPPALGEP